MVKARIHFSFMDCHAVQAVLPMTEKSFFQKPVLLQHDSKGCGGDRGSFAAYGKG